ncbi:hypothetical protein [Salinisphaera aquimarina]|uniref:Uncharacterized protein n=1 Tax=Salinisphaera aquimarina TaxID=2094031 RepID=A0ABV7EKQ2_9GAMM
MTPQLSFSIAFISFGVYAQLYLPGAAQPATRLHQIRDSETLIEQSRRPKKRFRAGLEQVPRRVA